MDSELHSSIPGRPVVRVTSIKQATRVRVFPAIQATSALPILQDYDHEIFNIIRPSARVTHQPLAHDTIQYFIKCTDEYMICKILPALVLTKNLMDTHTPEDDQATQHP
jgi:hypothetical protein